LGIPEGTIASSLARGRERLREKLQRSGRLVPVAGAMSLLIALPAGASASESLKHAVLLSNKSLLATKFTITAKAISWVTASVVVALGFVAVVEGLRREPEGISNHQIGISSLRQGLVGHWTFDEITGNAADSTGNGLTGVMSNGPVRTAGAIGLGLLMDGDNDQCDLPISEKLSMTTAFTVASWIYALESWDDNQRIFEHGYQKGFPFTEYGLVILPSTGVPPRRLTLEMCGVGAVSDSSIPLETWSHVAATWNGAIATVYINGKADGASVDIGGPIIDANNQSTIGYRADYQHVFHGVIDDLRVYDRALSPEEIASLARQIDKTGR
jgi:hypothetical protein